MSGTDILGVAMIATLVIVGNALHGWQYKEQIIATIKDNGCSTHGVSVVPSKTRVETYNYAMLGGE
ncbi:hypothetical protein OAP25_02115 [Flavobacteriaceae bacterium]|nr:hypothetical protein [Flavobacteriaceae bacterium]